jgi:hypothetical protein
VQRTHGCAAIRQRLKEKTSHKFQSATPQNLQN